MTPAEPPPEHVERTADSPALAYPPAAEADRPSEQPVLSEEEEGALVLHYLAHGRARRERRRRQLRIAVGALVVGACLLTAGLFWSRHQRPTIATGIIEPPAMKAQQSMESRAGGPAPSPPAVTPPVSPPVALTPAPTTRPPSPGTPTPPKATAPAPRVTDVRYQPSERLNSVHAGDAKETVFEVFGTRFERRRGSLVRVEGMRLRASGRSAQHAQVEVAEVPIKDAVAAGRLYWFLFGDGRLIAWGRAEDWPVATARYQVEIEYQPAPTPADRRNADRS